MEQNMETNKQNKTGRIIVITVLVIFLVNFCLFLIACNQEEAPIVAGQIMSTNEVTPLPTDISGTGIEATETPVDIVGTANVSVSEPSLEATAVANPDDPTIPTSTSIESKKAVETMSDQTFIVPYISDPDECKQAIAAGEVNDCISLINVNQITQPKWEQLLPGTTFYIANMVSYHDQEMEQQTRKILFAWQGDHYYRAENFDSLLSINNINVNDETRELIAQAFSLMTLPSEYLQHEIDFTHWEPVDIQGVFQYNYRLQAWTKLGGVEVTWGFVFNGEQLKAVSGGTVQNENIGDYIDYIEFEAGITRKDYEFKRE